MRKLIWNNIARRRGQALLTIAITALTVFAFVLVLGIFLTMSQGLAQSKERLGADAVVLPRLADTSAYELLFTAQPENIYMAESVLEQVRCIPGVQQASPQFYSQTLGGDCCSVGGNMRIVGFDPDTDFILKPYFSAQAYDTLGDDQVVFGGSTSELMGTSITILDEQFDIVGTLYPTGTGMDNTIFMNIDKARQITGDSEYADFPEDLDPFEVVSVIMVRLEEGADPVEFRDAINLDYQIPAKCLLVGSTISALQNQLGSTVKVLFALWIASLLVAVLALLGRFNALAKDRKKEVGLMRAIGIQRSQVFASIVGEAEVMALIGGAVGTAAALPCMAPVLGAIQEAFNLPPSLQDVQTIALCGAAGVALALLLGAVASFYPAYKCASMDPQTAIAQGELN